MFQASAAVLLLPALLMACAEAPYGPGPGVDYFGKVFVAGVEAPVGTRVEVFTERTRHSIGDEVYSWNGFWMTAQIRDGRPDRLEIVRTPSGYIVLPSEREVGDIVLMAGYTPEGSFVVGPDGYYGLALGPEDVSLAGEVTGLVFRLGDYWSFPKGLWPVDETQPVRLDVALGVPGPSDSKFSQFFTLRPW